MYRGIVPFAQNRYHITNTQGGAYVLQQLLRNERL